MVPSTFSTELPPAVAPILTILASSGVISVLKSNPFTKLDFSLLGLYPYSSKSTISVVWIFSDSPKDSAPGTETWSINVIILSSFIIGSILFTPPKEVLIPLHIDCRNLNKESLPSFELLFKHWNIKFKFK